MRHIQNCWYFIGNWFGPWKIAKQIDKKQKQTNQLSKNRNKTSTTISPVISTDSQGSTLRRRQQKKNRNREGVVENARCDAKKKKKCRRPTWTFRVKFSTCAQQPIDYSHRSDRDWADGIRRPTDILSSPRRQNRWRNGRRRAPSRWPRARGAPHPENKLTIVSLGLFGQLGLVDVVLALRHCGDVAG